jgi:DNA-binding NtrC family response regulator
MAVEVLKRSGPGSRVLVVDDESRLRDMLVRSASEMGFDPVSARSAEQALKLLEADGENVDIVLLDLNLPGMDGMDLLEQLRRRWPHVQVVILTGFGNLDSAKKAIRLDAVDFLTKPCPLEELEIALAKARRRRLEVLQPGLPEPAEADDQAAESDSPMTLEDFERIHILAALDRHGGNRAAAAAELGISERTMYYRLGHYQRREQTG